jgi:predicted nucleic acid-binding protein
LEVAMESNIFLDTHILVDIFLDRQPFSEYAIQLISQADKNQWHLHCSALTLANLLYILRKNKESDRLKALDIIQKRITVLDLKASDIYNSTQFSNGDLEDAIQIQVALSNQQNIIITRDIKGFLKSPVKVMTVVEFLNR